MARVKKSYRKKVGKKYGKRYYKRHYKRTSGIPRGVSTVANIPRMQKMRYTEDVTLNMAAGASAVYNYRANSIYDPNQTGAGHQPMRYDQIALFYADYCVVSSRITVKHVGAGGSNAPFRIVLYLNDTNAAAPLVLNDFIEQGRCKWRVTGAGVQRKQDVLKLGFSAKKFFGVTNIKDNISRIGASFGTNPSDQAMFILGVQPMDVASTINGEIFNVTIDYLVWCSQPILLASS